MKKFILGVGTDYYKVIDKLKNETIQTVLIDPEIGDLYHDTNNNILSYGMTFEDFINDVLTIDEHFNYDNIKKSIIISDRMIEHIQLSRLVTLIFPLFQNLAKYLNFKINLVFPNINLVMKNFKENLGNYNIHNLCNIEIIAFGGHKVILSPEAIKSYLDTVNFEVNYIEDITLDNKEFYSKISIEYKHNLSPQQIIENPGDMKPMDISDIKTIEDLGDVLWVYHNYVKLRKKKNDLRYIEFIDLEKYINHPYKELILINDFIMKYSDLYDLLTCENYFNVKDQNSLFNILHPYKSRIVFDVKK